MDEFVDVSGRLGMPRQHATKLAAQIGCAVGASVTKKTTLLILGHQDARQFAGHAKSSKHRKAETLIANGQKLQILTANEFKELVRLAA